jgi:nicotinamide phosphoribosyltransferase
MNIILNTDSYKVSHFHQYPEGTEFVSSYIEARGGMPETVFFGLQAFIKEYLTKPITLEDILEAEEVLGLHGVPFNKAGWMHILEAHRGHLPVEIFAIPEGTVIDTKNVLVSVVNTDPLVPWLTSYLETALLRAVWYPTTVATVSYDIRKVLTRYFSKAASRDAIVDFQLHDFGARGASSHETAMLGGMGHLLSFNGTDTLEAIMGARRYYGAAMSGFSIPAAEHSTITSWGRENEKAAFENMVDKFGSGMYAVVSDSYNIFEAAKLWGTELKDKVINAGGRLVVRPDSGDPKTIVLEVLEILGSTFGTKLNDKGYKVLHDSVRVIQGDGVNPGSIREILDAMINRRWSPENVAFGMGGALLQKVDRDTCKFAMKASSIKDASGWRDVYKDPITDPGKLSKKGLLKVVKNNGVYSTVPLSAPGTNVMRSVFRNGVLLVNEDFETIRARVR